MHITCVLKESSFVCVICQMSLLGLARQGDKVSETGVHTIIASVGVLRLFAKRAEAGISGAEDRAPRYAAM
jgi:hypothetical protein